MIKKLHEEKQLASALSLNLTERNEQLAAQVQNLQLENQRLSFIADEGRRRSYVTFAVSLLAVILVGIGVNVVTDQPSDWKGWVMITISVIMEAIAFAAAYQKQK